MARFSDLGVQTDAIVGKGIEIEDLFDKRILIEKVRIDQSKFPGKNASGKVMQMQVVLATFNADPDPAGDYFTKDLNGVAIGDRRCVFTASDNLMKEIEMAEAAIARENAKRAEKGLAPLNLYPIDATIVKVGKCFHLN